MKILIKTRVEMLKTEGVYEEENGDIRGKKENCHFFMEMGEFLSGKEVEVTKDLTDKDFPYRTKFKHKWYIPYFAVKEIVEK